MTEFLNTSTGLYTNSVQILSVEKNDSNILQFYVSELQLTHYIKHEPNVTESAENI